MTGVRRVARPRLEFYEWERRAACPTADPELFFHDEGERGPGRAMRDAAAVAVCSSCPVIEPCRAQVLVAREPFGVWGGLTEDDRKLIHGLADSKAALPLQATSGRERDPA